METTMVIRLALLTACLPGLLCQLPAQLIVHEWGTFTSIANPDGTPQRWNPLNTAVSDLPSFVHRFEGIYIKGGLEGTVRMETPVIYFYSDVQKKVSVKVDFPKGKITEFYPRAREIKDGTIDWGTFLVRPRECVRLPGHDDR